ncbi:MAG: hypothetical protein CVU11_12520 [Bacteroidetes bacterium HGW-Bacteroidetes-6]|nr:MAG: hypothetical protein CVU11_12520 [Bacteroidetes bacterium HGW-Bacteroidetes-6]
MYLKSLKIQNTGPIGLIEKEFPFHVNGNPKPLIIIGQNGSGKSILLSHIVNALISAKQTAYDDSEVEEGKVFKYRSPSYIKTGSTFSYSKVIFEDNLFQSECQLNQSKIEYEKSNPVPEFQEWNQIKPNEASFLNSNYNLY